MKLTEFVQGRARFNAYGVFGVYTEDSQCRIIEARPKDSRMSLNVTGGGEKVRTYEYQIFALHASSAVKYATF